MFTDRQLRDKLVYKEDRLTTNYLAVAEELTLLTPSVEEAARHISYFNHIAAKEGLRITLTKQNVTPTREMHWTRFHWETKYQTGESPTRL